MRDRYKIGEWGEDESKYGEERAVYEKKQWCRKSSKVVKAVKA